MTLAKLTGVEVIRVFMRAILAKTGAICLRRTPNKYAIGFDNSCYSLLKIKQYGGYRITGTHDMALSNRVSYEMDLRGPRYADFHIH